MDFIRQKTIPPIIFISERVCLRCTLHGYYSKTASFFYKFLKIFISLRDEKATLEVEKRIKEEGFEEEVDLNKIEIKC